MRGVLRSLPVFAPTEVSRITGLPCRSLPCSPFVASMSSACLRDQSDGLGSYSPVRGMRPSCHVRCASPDVREEGPDGAKPSDRWDEAMPIERGFVADAREIVWTHEGWFGNFTCDGFLGFWPIGGGTAASRRALVACLDAVSSLLDDFEASQIPR